MTVHITALQQAGQAERRLPKPRPWCATPDECAVQAMLAALRYDAGQRPAAQAMANRFVAAGLAPAATSRRSAMRPDGGRCRRRCADGGRALTRIAANEEYLRYWALQIMEEARTPGCGAGGFRSIASRARRRSWKPNARCSAHARERDAAATILAGLAEEGGSLSRSVIAPPRPASMFAPTHDRHVRPAIQRA
jgi:hypothetical protein